MLLFVGIIIVAVFVIYLIYHSHKQHETLKELDDKLGWMTKRLDRRKEIEV